MHDSGPTPRNSGWYCGPINPIVLSNLVLRLHRSDEAPDVTEWERDMIKRRCDSCDCKKIASSNP